MREPIIISVEGIDKTGKSTLLKYLRIMSAFDLVVNDRGPVSNMALAKLSGFDRNYDLSSFKNWTFIYLTCNKEDWRVRCAITDEKPVPYDAYLKAWNESVSEVENAGAKVLRYDTSKMTPYMIAKTVIETLGK